MSLTPASNVALRTALIDKARTNSYLLEKVNDDPSYADIGRQYPRRVFCVGAEAFEILQDLGGMAGEW